MSDAPRPLGPDDVHVWYTFTDEASGAAREAAYLALLCETERARHAQFKFAEDRHCFLVAHALLRTTLSRYAAVPPGQWRFRTAAHGRPEIAFPAAATSLRFNLSHTRGLVACAVTTQRDVGVDVERIDGRRAADDVWKRYFSPSEIEALAKLSSAARTDAFFDYWTLKESYIKARGLGLEIPLDGFSFDFPPGGRPAISFAASVQDDPAAWQFALHQPRPSYRLAVAARGRTELAFAIMSTIPAVNDAK